MSAKVRARRAAVRSRCLLAALVISLAGVLCSGYAAAGADGTPAVREDRPTVEVAALSAGSGRTGTAKSGGNSTKSDRNGAAPAGSGQPQVSAEAGRTAIEAQVPAEAGRTAIKPQVPAEAGRTAIEATAVVLIEAWDLNVERERLSGGSFRVHRFFHPSVSLGLEAMVLHVAQRLDDAVLGGAAVMPRWHAWSGTRATLFVEGGLGVSYSSTFVPEGGTRFNYLVIGGAGITRHMTGRVHLVAGGRWLHISNASLAGRHRNPDIESLGGYVGVRFERRRAP
jgi:hypothetical protein